MSESGGILRAGAVRSRLEAAFDAERSGQSYGAVGAALKSSLIEARRALLEQYARGDVIVARLSQIVDEALVALAGEASELLPPKSRIAVAATGGYGRGQLAPLSDLDLLILHSGLSEDALKPYVSAIIFPLYDAGLVVGQGVHTPQSAAKLAENEMTAMTAFLDARLVAGDERLFKDFTSKFEMLRWRTKTKFVKAKRAEQEKRHERSNQSRYLSEPDLKEGKGGLRDIHVIGWIYRALYGRPLGEAPKRGAIFRPDDAQSLKKAERFLLSVRVHLHDLRGRPDERLTFDVQPALAERLGYADRGGMTAAERMMKHYFVTTMEIGRLTRIFWARIEEENAKLLDRAPLPLPKALQSDEAGGKINLRLKNGRLDFATAAAAKNPVELFRYFRAFAKKPEIDFHPDALDLISKNANAVTSEVRRDPVVAQLFKASIVTAKDPIKLLRVMSETGLLGKYIPCLGQITGRVEYGLYRRYSLEEHVFQSIGVLTKIRAGELASEHPIATRILERDEDRLATYYLAVLLHQAGWSLKEPSTVEAEALIGRVARRLRLSDEDAAVVAWCAARPFFMIDVAHRRNLGEARAIRGFAEAVGAPERLDLLLVIAVCHLRAVSATAWDNWTKKQITALYSGAEAFIKGGDEALAEWMSERAWKSRKDAEILLEDWPKAERAAFMRRLSDETLAMIEPDAFARAADLARSADGCGVAASIRDNDVEAIVYADDRPGLLADLAGAVAGAGGNVRSVHAVTLDDGKIIDVFTMQPPDGLNPDAIADFVRRLHAALLAAARSRPSQPPVLARRIGDKRALFNVPARVRVDAEASFSAVVVEAEGRDRPGLLFSLASALAELGVAIKSAHIATYGERAVDAFYLQTQDGAKIDDKRLLQAIESRLFAVLGAATTALKATA